MLDQEDYIAEYDPQNALGVIADQPEQLGHQFTVRLSHLKIVNVVVAGMGGSALAGEFVKTWLAGELSVPLEVVRGYDLPGYVGADTLVIISSYSGNTEETVSAYEQAHKREAMVVVISAGGEVTRAAKDDKLPDEVLPAGLQPRLAVLYGIKALATVLDEVGLTVGRAKELEGVVDWLATATLGLVSSVPSQQNLAKQLAAQLHGAPVVIYAGPALASVSYKWKIDLNENAKAFAHSNTLSEMNHNELEGWSNPPEKRFKVIELHSSLDDARIQRRFEVGNRLAKGKLPSPIIVQVEGKTQLEQLLWAQLLGDFVSAYMALLYRTNPTPVPIMEQLKKELA